MKKTWWLAGLLILAAAQVGAAGKFTTVNVASNVPSGMEVSLALNKAGFPAVAYYGDKGRRVYIFDMSLPDGQEVVKLASGGKEQKNFVPISLAFNATTNQPSVCYQWQPSNGIDKTQLVLMDKVGTNWRKEVAPVTYGPVQSLQHCADIKFDEIYFTPIYVHDWNYYCWNRQVLVTGDLWLFYTLSWRDARFARSAHHGFQRWSAMATTWDKPLKNNSKTTFFIDALASTGTYEHPGGYPGYSYSEGNIGWYLDMKTDPKSDYPALAYRKWENGKWRIKYRVLEGTAWKKYEVVKGVKGGGEGISLAFNPKTKNPSIAYCDDGKLILATLAAGKWTRKTLGDKKVGVACSLAIDQSGLVFCAYVRDGKLKLSCEY